ncbi:efflux transporter outer membrane subunit [soil metagenome]
MNAFSRSATGSILLGAATSLVVGCATPVGPDYAIPKEALVQRSDAALPFDHAGGGNSALWTSQPLPEHWWRLYHDALLDRLVEQAFARNTDLRQAQANLERVQALEDETRGAQRPTIGVSGGPVYGHESGLSELAPDFLPRNQFAYGATASLSYTVDFTGQIRRAIEAAEAGTASADAALDLVRVHVAADVARAYASVCTNGLRIASAQHSVDLQIQAVDVSTRLEAAGRIGSLDRARAQSQLDSLRASIPPLEADRQVGLYQLATLTGELPRDFPREVQSCVVPPQVVTPVPIGDGAALLRRRPDIRGAERDLASATARIGVATADLYPPLTLGVSAGSAAPLPDLGGRDSFSWSLGPLISWTIPNTGIVQARIAQAEATSRGAFARFDGTVLTALRETETALERYSRELDRHASLVASRDAAADVAEQARRLYVGGRNGYLDSLDADRSLAASESALAASSAQLADDQVGVFLALGGGWER